jgi:sugar phosphate isomerase/epimerase
MPNMPSRLHNIFFSVPLGFLFANERLLGQYPVNTELFLDGDVLETLAAPQIQRVKGLLGSHRLRARVHGPISEMVLGAFDPRVREVSRGRFLQAMDFAAAVGSDAVVCHSGFDNTSKRGLEARFLEGFVPTLRSLSGRAAELGLRLVLENTFEPAPDLLMDALDGAAAANLGLCFDIAHQRVFGKTPLDEWIARCAPRIEEVHLTDNRGAWDDHLAPGRGSTDFDALFGLLRAHAVNAVFTFEPHSVEAFVETLRFIEQHPGYFL